MSASATVLCLRHCQSSGQEPDADLTGKGRADAQALAAALARWRPERLVTSPFRRARQTLEPLAQARALPLEVDARFREQRFHGPEFADWRPILRQSFADPDLRLPDGETSREAQARGLAALIHVAAQARRTVVATHGKLLSLLIGRVQPEFGYDHWLKLRNPDAFLFTFDGGRPVAVQQLDPFALT
ncbi:MAG: histidine phosphatase family protein [Opitutales bacterium]